MIGAFTLAVVAAAFMFVFWFSGVHTRDGVKTYQVVFTSSVSGLSRGSRVLFNGLSVGEVKKLDLLPNDPGKVYALIEVRGNTPVKVDTRARLEQQGLTGVASIALSGGSAGAANLPGDAVSPPVIEAEQSEIQNILDTVQGLASKVDAALGRIDVLIRDNTASINATVKNAERFSQALADNSGGIGDFMASISELGKTLRPTVANIEELTRNLNSRIAAIEPEKLRSIIDNADQVSSRLIASAEQIDKLVRENAGAVAETVKNAQAFSQTLAGNNDKVNEIITALAEVSKTIGPTVTGIETVARNIDERIRAIDPARIQSLLANADSLTVKLAGSVNKFDSFIDANAAPLTETVKNAQAFSQTLAGNSDLVNEIIAALGEVSKTIGPTVTGIETVARNIDERIRAIDPARIQSLLANADSLTVKLAGSVNKFDSFIDANSGPLTETVKNAQAFSQTLAGNSDLVNEIIAALGEVSKTIGPVVANLQSAAKNFDERLRAIDPDQVRAIVANADALAARLSGTVGKFDSFIDANSAPLTETVKNAQVFTRTLADNKEGIDKLVASLAGLGESLEPAIRNFETIAKDIGARVAAVDPEQLAKIVGNAERISTRLVGTADTLDKVLASLDSMLGDQDTKGAVAEIAETARSIRQLADNLDRRTKTMADGLNRFTGAGLRQYEALAVDGRRTLRQLDQTIRSLQKNPQQVIFGGRPSIPEYRGQ